MSTSNTNLVTIRDSHMDIAMGLCTVAFIGNILFSVTRNKAAANLLPLSFVLIMVCLRFRWLRNFVFTPILFSLIVLVSLHVWVDKAPWYQSMWVGLILYAPLIFFLMIIGFTRVDRLKVKEKEIEEEVLSKRKTVRELVSQLKEIPTESQAEIHGRLALDDETKQKAALYRLNAAILPKVLAVHSIDEVPPFLQAFLKDDLNVKQGMVAEYNEYEDSLVHKLSWGLPESDELGTVLRENLASDLGRWPLLKQHLILEKEITSHPKLAESRKKWFKELFTVKCIFPIRLEQKVRFAVFVGPQIMTAKVKFKETLVTPPLQILERILQQMS